MEAKEFLKQAYWIDRQINLDREKKKNMRESLYGRTSSLSAGGSSGGGNNNYIEDAIHRVIEYEKKIDKEINELIKKKLEIENVVKSLPVLEREVVERKYFLLQDWDTIAKKMNFCERRVYQIHGDALKKISLNFSIET